MPHYWPKPTFVGKTRLPSSLLQSAVAHRCDADLLLPTRRENNTIASVWPSFLSSTARPSPPPSFALLASRMLSRDRAQRPKARDPVGSQIPIPSERNPSSILGKSKAFSPRSPFHALVSSIGIYGARTDNFPSLSSAPPAGPRP